MTWPLGWPKFSKKMVQSGSYRQILSNSVDRKQLIYVRNTFDLFYSFYKGTNAFLLWLPGDKKCMIHSKTIYIQSLTVVHNNLPPSVHLHQTLLSNTVIVFYENFGSWSVAVSS